MEKNEKYSLRRYKNGLGSKLLGYAFKGGLMLTLIAPTVLNSVVALAEGSSSTVTSSSAVVTQPETTPEVAYESTGTQQDLANAQNLKEAKPEETEAKKTQLAEAGKTSGHIDHYESSAVLDKAVEAAKLSGVVVNTSGEVKVYNSAKEALADYETQAKSVAEVVVKYEAMKKAHAEATKKYQDYTKAKGVYDTEKAKYDQDEAKYKQDKAQYDAYLKLKADYDKAVDAYNKAYTQYEKDLAAYQAAVKANVELVAKYEKEKAAFDKAYTLYQDELKKAKAIEDENAEKQKVYDIALVKYNTDQAAYEKALAAYNTTIANNKKLQTDHDAAMKKYEADLADYKVKKAAYDKDKAAHDKAMADAAKLSGTEGYLSKVYSNEFKFDKEKNSKTTIEGDVKFISADYHKAAGANVLNTRENLKHTVPQAESYYLERYDSNMIPTIIKKDSPVTVTSELNESYFNGKKLGKVVHEYTLKGNPSDDQVTAYIFTDPTRTIKFGNSYDRPTLTNPDGVNDATTRTRIEDNVTWYYEDGTKVDFSEANGIFSVASMNAGRSSIDNNRGYYEYVEFMSDNLEFIPITGSAVFLDGKEISAKGTDINFERENKDSKYYDWDNAKSPVAYRGAGAVRITEGTTIKLAFGASEDHEQWFSLNTDVETSEALPVRPVPPKEPAKPTPPAIKDPEKPTAPTKPTLALKEVPKVTPPVEPAKPAITTPREPGKPTAPTAPSEVPAPSDPGTPPSEPTPVPQPPALEKLSVEIHTNKWTTQPKVTKTVTNAAGDNLDGQLIPKGQTVTFTVKAETLQANREMITEGVWVDNLPQGMTFTQEGLQAENPAYAVAYDEKANQMTLTLSKETLVAVNADRSKVYNLPEIKATGTTENDGAVYENVATLSLNGDFTSNSNKVGVTTPGLPEDPENPDKPGTSFIKPTKDVLDADGKSINDGDLVVGDTVTYKIKYDMNQHKGIVGDKLIFAVGDDFDGKSVTVDLETVKLVDDQGQAYEGITPAIYESMDAAPAEVQAKYANQDYQFDGDFLDVAINDSQDFYETVVKPGRDLHLTFDFEVIKGAGKDIQNTAVQVDFGNVYVTNTVVNHPLITTEWVQVDVNGKEIKTLKDKVTGENTEEAGEFDNLKFVETIETETGIKHQFIQLYTTEWETTDGKTVLKDKDTDTTTKPKEDFGGYKFIETVETKTGLKHLYTRTTEWVDEEGKPLKDLVENPELQDKGSFDGYEFVKTIETPTGIKHIFKKKAAPKKEEKKETPASSTSTPAQPTPAVQRTVSTPQTVTETRLPSTGEIVGYGSVLGLGLLGGIVAWKTGLFKKIKALFSK